MSARCAEPRSRSASSRSTRATTAPRTSSARSRACARPRRAARRSSASRSCSTRRTSASRRTRERFDLAEPIPGPTTERMQALARELGVVLIVPLFERQAAGRLPQLGGHHRRRRRRCSACIARCTSPTTRSSTRSTTSRRAMRPRARAERVRSSQRLRGLADALRARRRPDLLGPVVSRGRAHHVAARRRRALLSDGDRLAPGREERVRRGAGRGLAHHPALRTRSRTASSSRRPIASGSRPSRAPKASSSSDTRSSATRSVACSPRRSASPRSWSRRATRRSSRRRAATGRSCAIGASTRTAAILSRWLGCMAARAACGCPPSGSRTARPGSRGRTTSPTGRASSSRSRGSTPRSRACSPRTSASRSSARASACARRRARSSRRTAFAASACGCTSCRPTASGCATRRPRACIAQRRPVALVNWALQRLGEVRQLRARRARSARRSQRITGLPRDSCRMRPDGERVVLEGGAHRRRTAPGSLLVTEECLLSPTCRSATPGSTRDGLRARVPRVRSAFGETIWLGEGCVGRRHARPRGRHRALRRAGSRACSPYEEDPADENHARSVDNLRATRAAACGRLRVDRSSPTRARW